MSPEVVAALLGVLGGVIIERVARSWGWLWFESSEWDIRFRVLEQLPERDVYLEPERAEDAEWVEFSVRIDLFNGKEMPVGLRDVVLVFVCAGGELRHELKRVTTGPSAGPAQLVPGTPGWVTPPPPAIDLRVLNLPPRQWVSLELDGTFSDRADIRRLARWYRVEFVGQRQRRGPLEPKTFRRTISSRLPLPDPGQRRLYI